MKIAAASPHYSSSAPQRRVIDALVQSAETISRRQFPPTIYRGFSFNADRWDLNASGVGGGKQMFVPFLTFKRNKSGRADPTGGEPLPTVFSDVIKAWLIHSDMRIGRMVDMGQGARRLWEGISKRRGAQAFSWDSLCAADLEAAEKLLLKHTPKSHSHFTSSWSCLLEWLISNELISDGLSWTSTNVVKREQSPSKQLPRHEILEALADIYRELAVSSFDRLLICTLGLQQVAGFRVSELLSLPEDCWVREVVNGRERFGIRYWLRKSRGGAFKHATRWLSPIGSELAWACLKEIRSLTSAARAQAKRLEREPDRVRIHKFRGKVWLTRAETAEVFGMVPGSLAPLLRSGALRLTPRKQGYRKWTYARKDIEAELLRRRPPLFTMQISGNKYQRLSESLLITFVYANDIQAGTCPLLVRTLPDSSLVAFIGGYESSTPSAFTRFKLHEKYGGKLRLRVHQLRHWLNTIANKSGMSAFQVTLWMQRKSIKETRLYLHDTRDIAELTREYVRGGRAIGPIAEMYREVAADDGERRLDSVQEAHILEGSICAERITVESCDRGKLCEADCAKAVWINGPETSLAVLERRRTGLKNAIEAIRQSRENGQRVVMRQIDIYKGAITRLSAIINQLEESRAS